jgi:hypothetical protein
MLRVYVKFTAIEPIHTGSDQNLGTLRTLRREKTYVSNVKTVKSRFRKEQKKLQLQAIALLLLRLWDKMDNKARVTIYEEIASKLLYASTASTKESFLQILAEKLDIREISTDKNRRFDVVDILELFDDYELLELVRRNSQYIVALFRKIKDNNFSWKKNTDSSKVSRNTTVSDANATESPEVIISNQLIEILSQPFEEENMVGYVDYVPAISGNSIRGLLRRLVMEDFCKKTGITSLSPEWYHRLFTGGTLSESTGYEDIGKRLELIRMCPPIGLFGSAIGNQTIQGALKVGAPKLICSENKNGMDSYHNFIDIIFGTRLDSSKTETAIMIVGEDKETHQMKYEYEVFVPGSVFEMTLAIDTEEPILKSAFYTMLELFSEHSFILAKSSVGHGNIKIDSIVGGESKNLLYLYSAYLNENKEVILKYFSNE